MDGRKSPGYPKRPSFYDLKYWSEDEVRASYGAALGNACTPQQASEAFYHGLLQLTRERTN